MIGASVYFSEFDLEYVKQIADMGIKALFTTVVMPEEQYDERFEEKLQAIKEIAQKNQIELITDISEKIYDKLNIESVEDLKAMGFNSLRLDSGFRNPETVKELTEKFQVYLNGSHMTKTELEAYKAIGVDMQKISIMHNFYPKRFSGVDEKLFKECNELFRLYNVKIVAFVAGDYKLRGPEYIGLPTLEKHRGVNPYVAYLELIKANVDDVFIGDSQVAIHNLQLMIDHNQNGIFSVPCCLEKEVADLYNQTFGLRDDYSNELFRISLKELRVKKTDIGTIIARKQGMITVDNSYAGRYLGEINICRQNLPIDKGITNIGFVKPDYISMLDFIDRGGKVKLVK